MDRDQLLKKLSQALTKKGTVQLAMDKACKPDDLIGLSLYPQAEIAFRASWILEQLVYFRWDDLVPSLPDLISVYLRQGNRSCQRHFTKIMMYLTHPESSPFMKSLIDSNQGQIIERTFEWLIDPETPVAVKVNCMDILLNLRSGSEWIPDELRSQIQYLLKDGSAAIQSRGKRVLKKLKT